MLIGIPALLGPDFLATLRAMGHGDELAIVDGNYPAEEHGRRVLRADGHGLIAVIDAVLTVLPVDDFVPEALFRASVKGDPSPARSGAPRDHRGLRAPCAGHDCRSPARRGVLRPGEVGLCRGCDKRAAALRQFHRPQGRHPSGGRAINDRLLRRSADRHAAAQIDRTTSRPLHPIRAAPSSTRRSRSAGSACRSNSSPACRRICSASSCATRSRRARSARVTRTFRTGRRRLPSCISSTATRAMSSTTRTPPAACFPPPTFRRSKATSTRCSSARSA